MPTLAVSGYFLAILSDSKLLLDGNVFFDHPEEFEVCDDLKVISNENIDVDDPQNVDNFSALDDPEGISIGSMEFDLKKSIP